MRRRAGTSESAWTTTESVAEPAKSQIIGPVHSDGSRGCCCPVRTDAVRLPEDDEEEDETGDRHDVGDEGRPRERAELPSRVEDLPEQGEEAVEEDLRQADEREREREVLELGRGVAREQPHEAAGAGHDDDGDERHRRPGRP